MPKVRTRVDRLRPGDTVTGTAASGEFTDGPRLLLSRTPAPEHSTRGEAWLLTWDGGGRCVLYGSTEVDVQRLAVAS